MEYLHSLSPPIIHRDLKSLNILKAFNGSLKICDFGLVKNKNTTAGTPAYMAPGLFYSSCRKLAFSSIYYTYDNRVA